MVPVVHGGVRVDTTNDATIDATIQRCRCRDATRSVVEGLGVLLWRVNKACAVFVRPVTSQQWWSAVPGPSTLGMPYALSVRAILRFRWSLLLLQGCAGISWLWLWPTGLCVETIRICAVSEPAASDRQVVLMHSSQRGR